MSAKTIWAASLIALCFGGSQAWGNDPLRGALGAILLDNAQVRASETPEDTATRLANEARYVARVQTWLEYYGFYDGPVDAIAGPGTHAALDAFAAYVHQPPLSVAQLHGRMAQERLGYLERTHAARRDVDPETLDTRDRARLAEEGPRFWLRAGLRLPQDRRGVRTTTEQDRCGAWDNADLIGQVVDPRSLPQLTVPGSVRVIGRGPMTMDLRPDRLTIRIDPWDVVIALSCG